MKKHTNISRRDVTKQIGIAAGISLLGPGITQAAAVTPEQTEGPFYPIDEQADMDMDLTLIEGHSETAEGETILIRGRLSDADGRPLDDARWSMSGRRIISGATVIPETRIQHRWIQTFRDGV